MEPIIFRKTSVNNWNDSFLLFTWASIFGAVLHMSPLLSGEFQDGAHSVIRVLAQLILALVFFRMALPRHNRLQFDKDGLTYKRAGGSRAWPWRDISAFTPVQGWWRRRIEFTVSGHHGRWWHIALLRRTKAGLTVTIPDIWDTPLEDIAATLNACRERATGGGNGPASPERA